MTDREIQDTPTDRAAAVLMQEAAGRVLYAGEDAGQLDAAWRSTALAFAAMDEDAFSRAHDGIEARRETTPAEVMDRVDELTAHLVEWRHRGWEADEAAAGRDPDRPA